MKKPILVTQLSNELIEVITDYKLNIKSAETPKGPLSILRVVPEVGLLGTLWHLEGESIGNHLSILASIGNAEVHNEYSFRL